MFALIDCNNFYASCEQVFKPMLIGKPIVILSNNDGCVIARNNHAKPFVPMGAPAHKYEQIFREQQIHVFSSNYALYGDISNRVMSILSHYTPDLEIYSIDEAFLFFNEFKNIDYHSLGKQIKEKVQQTTRIPISVGFATTKALAKIANKIAKKFDERTQGVYVIDSEEKRIKALKWTKIEDVWGIGRRMTERLRGINITNAFQFSELPDEFVLKEFSIVGLRLKKELQGISCLELENSKNKKNISTTRSFAKDITDFDSIQERVSTFTSNCAERMRNQKTVCQAIMVFIRTNKFQTKEIYNRSIILPLPYPSNSDITLNHFATKGLKIIYKKGYSYKKAGVIALDLVPENTIQLNLFEYENPKHKALMQAMDKINYKAGVKKVKLACQNPNTTWTMRQDHLSKRHTTNWNELLEVK